MKQLAFLRVIALILVVMVVCTSCNSRLFSRMQVRKAERSMAGPERSSRRIIEPKAARKAKKTQEKNQEKLKADYYKSVNKSKKRTVDIQTPEVQERMKQDIRNIKKRDKTVKKRSGNVTHRGAKKYS
jgi:hypothetical protein